MKEHEVYKTQSNRICDISGELEHADVARKLAEHGKPISAGQIIKIGQRLICMGDSMSLGGLEAGPTDTDDLQSQVARVQS